MTFRHLLSAGPTTQAQAPGGEPSIPELVAEVYDAEALGSPRRTLAYPNGDFDGRVTRIAHDLGFRLAFALGGLASAIPAPRVHSVNRLYVDSRMSLDRFAIIASGLLPAALRARRTLRGIGPPRRARSIGAAVT